MFLKNACGHMIDPILILWFSDTKINSNQSDEFFFFFKNICHRISSDFSDLPDMTDEYIDLSVYALTGLLLYVLYTYIQK